MTLLITIALILLKGENATGSKENLGSGNMYIVALNSPPQRLQVAKMGYPRLQYVLDRVAEAGINPKIAEAVIRCESNWKPTVVSRTSDYGLWQLNLPSHPSVTKECALDVNCSTEYAIQMIKRSGWYPWVCARNLGYVKM